MAKTNKATEAKDAPTSKNGIIRLSAAQRNDGLVRETIKVVPADWNALKIICFKEQKTISSKISELIASHLKTNKQ